MSPYRTSISSTQFVFITIITFGFLNSYGQKEEYNWFFGRNAGLSFHTSPPTPLYSGEVFTEEGCASISDTLGNVLFYTDGSTVFNKMHNMMPNGKGLYGNSTSTQSAVILKMPESESKYYVFTVTKEGERAGFRYSIVDMDLSNGLGDVILESKNTLIRTPVTEKVAATRHENGNDLWVVVHGVGNDSFHTYLLTKNGLKFHSDQASGLLHTSIRGYLKFSPTGSRLASAANRVELFDFDRSTGKVSSFRTYPQLEVYGLEFSPNERFLYSADRKKGSLYQHDIDENITQLLAEGVGLGAMQIGPNGKIYIAQYESKYLGEISQPNLLAPDCFYKRRSIFLDNICTEGLPTFISTNKMADEILVKDHCLNETAHFKPSYVNPVAQYSWDFGDTSKNFDTSHLVDPYYVYTQPGIFDVVLTIVVNGYEHTLRKKVEVQNSIELTLDSAIQFCPPDSIELDAGTGGSEFKWNNGLSHQKIWVSTAGKYSVKIREKNCTVIDEVFVNQSESVSLDIGRDTFFCHGVVFTLDAGEADSVYWWNGSRELQVALDKSGVYWVEKYHDGCSAVDTIEIGYFPLPPILETYDSLCELDGGSVLLLAPTGTDHYWASLNDSADKRVIYNEGHYQVRFLNNDGCPQKKNFVINSNCPFNFNMPNSFTPNGDEHNPLFRPQYFNVYKVHLRIFNRWGECVYDKLVDSENGWDGTFNGENCPAGVYVYHVSYEHPFGNGKKQVWLNGNLTLLR